MTARARWTIPAVFCALALLASVSGFAAEPEKTEKPAPPAADDNPQLSEPRLLRLAEILGALTYLQDLCKDEAKPGQKPGRAQSQVTGEIWRMQMTALLEAEGKTPARKERLAGAYNRGFRGYELNYRHCTPNAQAIIARFLDESGRLAHEMAQREGPS